MRKFGNQKASYYTSGSQWGSIIELGISNPHSSKPVSKLLNIASRAMGCCSTGLQGASKVLESINKVDRQGKYIDALGGVTLIRRHHLGCYLARNQNA